MYTNHTTERTDTGSIGSAVKRGPKSLKRALPESIKDERYWERRKKNNISAKRSREKTKQVESLIRSRYISLENENAFLRRELKNIKLKYGILPSDVFLNDEDREECSKEADDTILKVLGNSGKHGDCDPTQYVDRITDENKLARAACHTPPDTTTSSANVSHVITGSSADEQTDTSPRPQEYLWNRSPGSSPTPQYTFYRPMEEDSNSMDNSPADLSMNKKSKLADPDASSKHFGKSIKESHPETALRLAMNKGSTEFNSTLRDVPFVAETFKGTTVLTKSKSRNSVESEQHTNDNVAVLDLTKDDDDTDESENLSLKLQKLSDQIEVMQRLVGNKVGAKQDSGHIY